MTQSTADKAKPFQPHALQALIPILLKAPLPPFQPGRVQPGPLMFTERGAALFLAHIAIHMGEAKVLKLKGPELVDLALRFRAEKPHAWQAMRLGDTVRLAHFERSTPAPRPSQVDYQALLDQVLATAPIQRPVAPHPMPPTSAA